MTNHHHQSKYLCDLFNSIFSGGIFEKRNEDIFQPVSVKSWFFVKYFKNRKNTWVSELPESSFHKFEELLFHFITEKLISSFVVSEENILEIAWINFINFLFNFGIHFNPEFFIFTIEFLHQVIKLHQINSFYFIKVFINVLESLIDPRMLVPIVILLTLNFW